jgi:hypothetical protein
MHREAKDGRITRGESIQIDDGASAPSATVVSRPHVNRMDSAAGEVDQVDHFYPPSSSSRLSRLYGVCLSLLYFFVFPCAQTALAALACTDTRQYDSSSGGIDGVTSQLYLNLHPWQACDSAWRRSILPPAAIGVLLWFIAFPILTTLLYRYLRHHLTMIRDPAVWPLCADLFTPYRPSHWYYEQILLGRRLALVACVSLIPADSLYLPLMLFTLIQLSALLQHRMQPYASVWMNRGELASLYLLLLNYITALVLHQSAPSSGGIGGGNVDRSGGGHSLDGWTVALFLLNLLFLLVLIAGLFVSLQSKLLRALLVVRRRVVDWCSSEGEGDGEWTANRNAHTVGSTTTMMIGRSHDRHRDPSSDARSTIVAPASGHDSSDPLLPSARAVRSTDIHMRRFSSSALLTSASTLRQPLLEADSAC